MHQQLPFTIRRMEPGDIPRVIAIERLSFATPWPASSFSRELNHVRCCYCVLLRPAPLEPEWRRWMRRELCLPGEGQVIGYVGFRLRRREAHITTLAVHPDWRERGLGELLLLTAMEKMLERRVNVVTLELRASNRVAHHLYWKYGFRLEGMHPNYYRDGEDAWLMVVEIEKDIYENRLTTLRRALEARLCCERAVVGQNEERTL